MIVTCTVRQVDSAFWQDFERLRSASKAKEQRVKDRLKAIFPSFADEIERLRIRHHIELIPILERTDPRFREHMRYAFYSNGSRNLGYYQDLEKYIAENYARGYYERGRTIAASYFAEYPELERFSLHGTHVHEFIHYVTEILLRRNFGRAVDMRTDERHVPTDVREALAFAFQHAYLEQYGIPVNHKRAIDNIVDVYSKESLFDRKRFERTYWATLDAIKRHGFDAAAKRIPEIVENVLKIEPRNLFKRR